MTFLLGIVPTLLSVAVIAACIITLFDLLFLYRKRLAALDLLSQSIGNDIADARKKLAYEENLQSITQLPKVVHYARHYWFTLLLILVAVHFLVLKSDVDFPLYMVLAVFISGLIALYDICVCRKKRIAITRRIADQLSLTEDTVSTKASESSKASESTRANKDTKTKDAEADDQPGLLAKLGEPIEVGYAKSFFPILFVVLVLRSFIVEPFQIPSASMVPSLEIGDFILVNKYTYGIRLPVIRNKVIDINKPKRGDVMVFFPPHQKRYFIKRVVGLPGDELHYVNNVLYVNGKKMSQTLVASLPPGQPVSLVMREDLTGVDHLMQKNIVPGPLSDNFTTVVPEGHYFMMGDNRDNSSDSREWGAVPEENIVGKAFAIWMHWDAFFSLPSFSRAGAIE